MALFLTDTFTDTDAVVVLSSHTSDSGATWTKHPSFETDTLVFKDNRLVKGGANGAAYYASAIPDSAEYDVNATVVVKSLASNVGSVYLSGRYSTSTYLGYTCRLDAIGTSTIRVALYKDTGSSSVQLGSNYDLTGVAANDVISVKLEIRDAAKKVYINGVERISSANNDNTAAGRVVVRSYNGSATTGLHVDSLTAGILISAVDAALPMLSLAATVDVGAVGLVAATLPLFRIALGENSVTATLPPLTVAIDGATGGVGSVAASLPASMFAATAATGNVGEFAATLPTPTLAMQGNQDQIDATFPLVESFLDGYSAVLDATFPLYAADLVGLNGAVGALDAQFFLIAAAIAGGVDGIDAVFPLPAAEIAGLAGINGALDVRFAVPASAFTGASVLSGDIDALWPLLATAFEGWQTTLGAIDASFALLQASISGRLGTAGGIDARLPALASEFIGWTPYTGSIEAAFYLLTGAIDAAAAALPIAAVLAVNLKHGAVTEYEGFSFNSLANFNGQPLAANASGIHALTGEGDGAASIAARIRSGQNDLTRAAGPQASAQLKRPTDAYVSYQSLSGARFSIVVDAVANDYHLPGDSPVLKTHKTDLGRGLKTRYLQWQLENLDGQALDVDHVMIRADVLRRRV